ncbi:hypothetical protein LINPERPRIM_LOCUS29795 [Linum perenne]
MAAFIICTTLLTRPSSQYPQVGAVGAERPSRSTISR